jgi:hypothetical protein
MLKINSFDLQQGLELWCLQSVPFTTKVVSSNPAHGEVYLIQHYVIKLVSNLWQVNSFLQVFQLPSPMKTTTALIYNNHISQSKYFKRSKCLFKYLNDLRLYFAPVNVIQCIKVYFMQANFFKSVRFYRTLSLLPLTKPAC